MTFPKVSLESTIYLQSSGLQVQCMYTGSTWIQLNGQLIAYLGTVHSCVTGFVV